MAAAGAVTASPVIGICRLMAFGLLGPNTPRADNIFAATVVRTLPPTCAHPGITVARSCPLVFPARRR